MIILIRKTMIKRFCCLFCSCFFVLSVWHQAFGEEKKGEESPPQIHVSADKLISDRNKQYGEFLGNVVAVRGEATLTCDNLKIFYSEKKEKTAAADQAGAIDKMIATVNVKLTFEDKVAVAEKAVYTADDDSIVLTGGPPTVTSGDSYVSGDKITLFRTGEKVIVDSGKGERVRAEFHPGDEALLKKDD